MEAQSNGIPLKGRSAVVYDLEIKKPIGEDGVTWEDHHRMGISVGVSFDYRTGDFTTYFDDNMASLVEQLHSAELIVGFNQIGFDNKLLRASGYPLKPDSELNQYDILEQSRRAIGPGFHKGLKLDNHLEGMFGREMMKTGHGELAPIQYQKKQWGPLVSYCIADVRRTCLVFEHIWEHQFVVTPAHGKQFVGDPRLQMKR